MPWQVWRLNRRFFLHSSPARPAPCGAGSSRHRRGAGRRLRQAARQQAGGRSWISVRAKRDRSDDATAAKGNRRTTPRTRNPPRTKLRPRAKRRNPLKRRTKQRSTKQSQDAEPAKTTSRQTHRPKRPGRISRCNRGSGASADPTTDSAILTAAAADAILPAITADAPVAAAPTVASRGTFAVIFCLFPAAVWACGAKIPLKFLRPDLKL